jgi:hypothetical protein
MKAVILIITLLLSGCTMFVPVKRNFPEAPVTLMVKCPQLETVQGDKVAITDMLKTIVNNYRLYYECSNRVEGWGDWYVEQKKIFDSVK